MKLPEKKYCPGTLSEGFNTYSVSCLRKMFYGKSVSHLLNMPSPKKDEKTLDEFMENLKHISVSGFQTKASLTLNKNVLRFTHEGEQGTHILKPVPFAALKNVYDVPANEHVTMQIAAQVYGIHTAGNALVFFNDGEPAYITRRFDIKEIKEKTKWGQEDFASLAGKTTRTSNEKYEYSYEELGLLIQKYIPAWKIEIEKYFSVVVFNYLFSNGDAHLKNFSILESPRGDFQLCPAYDLMNTRMHVNDSDFAMKRGLFADKFKSAAYKKNNHAGKQDFVELGKRIGLNEKKIERILQPFLEQQPFMETLVNRSLLSDKGKRGYLMNYHTRKNYLNA